MCCGVRPHGALARWFFPFHHPWAPMTSAPKQSKWGEERQRYGVVVVVVDRRSSESWRTGEVTELWDLAFLGYDEGELSGLVSGWL